MGIALNLWKLWLESVLMLNPLDKNNSMDSNPRENTKRMTIDVKSNETLKIRSPHSMDDQRDLVKENFQTLAWPRIVYGDASSPLPCIWEPKPYGKQR